MVHTIGPVTFTAGRTFFQWISRAGRDLVRNARHRHEIKALAELDDRLLKDVGLTRSDVAGALSGSLLDNPSVVLVRSAGRHSRSERPSRPARPGVPTVTRPVRTCP
jgi:uncharacterized protein YjiS (DUF1127 family)